VRVVCPDGRLEPETGGVARRLAKDLVEVVGCHRGADELGGHRRARPGDGVGGDWKVGRPGRVDVTGREDRVPSRSFRRNGLKQPGSVGGVAVPRIEVAQAAVLGDGEAGGVLDLHDSTELPKRRQRGGLGAARTVPTKASSAGPRIVRPASLRAAGLAASAEGSRYWRRSSMVRSRACRTAVAGRSGSRQGSSRRPDAAASCQIPLNPLYSP